MNEKRDFSRRKFIERGIIGAAGVGLTFSGNPLMAQTTFSVSTGLKPGQFKLGIIGCGNRAKTIISALNNVPEIEISALCDLVDYKMGRRAKLIKDGPMPEFYTDMDDLFKRDDLDAVAVLTPNFNHHDIVISALAAGKNVFCEKPMALTVADCNDMIGAVERSGKALQIGTQRRHSVVYKKLVEVIRNKPVGQILQSSLYDFRGDWRVPNSDEYPPGLPYWRMDQKLCGGVVYEMGAHIIDVNNWIFNSEPIAVSSLQSVNNFSLRKRNSTDHAGVVVEYANGAMMNYGGNVYNYGSTALDTWFGVGGTVQMGDGKASIQYGYPRGFDNPGKLPENEVIDLRGDNPETEGVVDEMKHFAKVLAGEAKPYPDGIIGRQMIQICEGSVRSAQERRVIDIKELG